MSAWQRARLTTLCGGCGDRIDRGAPVLVLVGPGWTKFRCTACAGEPVATDVDADRRSTPTATTIGPRFAERLSAVRSMAQDFKHAQAGDR